MRFTRDPGPLHLIGIRTDDLDALADRLESEGVSGSWVAADLTFGAWRGHQVAREICSQLTIEFEDAAAFDRPGHGPPRTDVGYANTIGRFIDAEALGDQATLSALTTAGRIRERLPERPAIVFLIVVPPAGTPWERENVIFIRILAQALRGTPSRLVLVAASAVDPDLPADWIVEWDGARRAVPATDARSVACLVPGVITAELADALRKISPLDQSHAVPLLNGQWLIRPSCRRPLDQIPRLDFDQLGVLARPWPWLDAFAQCRGNTMHVEPWFLFREAQHRVAEGGLGVALRLLERAVTRVTGPDWGVLQSFAQGLRVASHRFAEAAAIPDPPSVLPCDQQSFLLQGKGWGLVMLGELGAASACFTRAKELLPDRSRYSAEHLYLLNISALCAFKAGNVAEAVDLERAIESHRPSLAPPDWHLTYVNAINIARLCRSQGERGLAERYFSEAFATAAGARTDSDAIYENLIFAQLHSAAGRFLDAFTCWMRAGLYWAACDAPEALGRRVVRYLIGRELDQTSNMPELVSASLCNSIGAAAAAAFVEWGGPNGLPAAGGGGVIPVFARAESVRRINARARFDRALLCGGLSVLGMHDALLPSISGEQTERLRWLLSSILASRLPRDFLSCCATIAVDDGDGRGMAVTRDQLMATCARLDVGHVAIEGVEFTVPEPVRATIEQALRVTVGTAVDGAFIDENRIVVSFKRYLAPFVLSPAESQVFAAVDDQKTVADLRSHFDTGLPDASGEGFDVLHILRTLEHAHIIDMGLPAGSCGDGASL